MADAPSTPEEDDAAPSTGGDADPPDSGDGERPVEELSEAELRERVEAEYDFDDFGPEQMAEMTPEEWDAAFDDDTWITGSDLLDRVEADLATQIADRQVFAVLERVTQEGEERLLAYSDEGYAMVSPDGTVEGFGTVMRDVKPTVALCSMESYTVPEPPEEGAMLPDPESVPEGSGELGNLMLQVIAAIQILGGVVLLGGWVFADLSGIALVAALGFFFVGVVLFTTVANARLSDRFRAEEYRGRLRSVGLEAGERPEFLPIEDGDADSPPTETDGDDAGSAEPGETPDGR
ncbi:DUF7319 domain-containing protein [Halostella salina]|uniref:DUF7319 domain-containing protein n=1 Tax=Halostella salina TaxID=1547897 RepID=UPI001969D757|nr:hypothetical protein [Halostella salina]